MHTTMTRKLRVSRDTAYHEAVKKVESEFITNTLRDVNGNQVKAAMQLGISRNTLRKKMKIYNLK